MAKIIILGIFIAYGLKRIFQIPSEAAASFTPFLPNGAGGVVIAMGLTFIAFEGYDLIATVAEEIKAPEKTIPRATLISLCVTVFIYLMVLLVCTGAIQPDSGKSWQFMGRYQQSKSTNTYSYRILVPLHNPDHVIPLMKLAVPIAKAHEGEIIVLGVIDVPKNLPPHEGMRFVHHKTPLLRKAIEYGHEQGVETRSAIRIAHQVWDGILHTAEAEKATLVLMGWKGFTTTRDRIMGEVSDKVVRLAPCDLITVKLMGDRPIRLIVLGASKEGVFSNVLFGVIPEKVARYAKTPVMIVQRYEGPVKTLVKRIMG